MTWRSISHLRKQSLLSEMVLFLRGSSNPETFLTEHLSVLFYFFIFPLWQGFFCGVDIFFPAAGCTVSTFPPPPGCGLFLTLYFSHLQSRGKTTVAFGGWKWHRYGKGWKGTLNHTGHFKNSHIFFYISLFLESLFICDVGWHVFDFDIQENKNNTAYITQFIISAANNVD